MTYCIAALCIAIPVAVGFLSGWHEGRKDRRAAQAVDAAVDAVVADPLPQREPGAAKAVIDEGVTREERYAHLDAVWAQCSDSEPYVAAMLASHEAEVTHLLELALELDDQAPRGGDQRGHVAE